MDALARFQTLLQPCRWTVDLVLPPECVWCAAPIGSDDRLCEPCSEIFTKPYVCCWKCAAPLPSVVDRTSCPRCREVSLRFERAISLGAYRGKLREAILLMKRPYYEALAMAVGKHLAHRCLAELGRPISHYQATQATASDSQLEGASPSETSDPLIIIPVPNHWTRRLAHRTSTADTLAEAISEETGWSLCTKAVVRQKKTTKQGILPWSSRPQNVRGAFRVNRPHEIRGRSLLIVDDVITSGATAAELTRVLLAAGASSVWVASVARGTGTRDNSPSNQPD